MVKILGFLENFLLKDLLNLHSSSQLSPILLPEQKLTPKILWTISALVG
jgi:hypothetical protein